MVLCRIVDLSILRGCPWPCSMVQSSLMRTLNWSLLFFSDLLRDALGDKNIKSTEQSEAQTRVRWPKPKHFNHKNKLCWECLFVSHGACLGPCSKTELASSKEHKFGFIWGRSYPYIHFSSSSHSFKSSDSEGVRGKIPPVRGKYVHACSGFAHLIFTNFSFAVSTHTYKCQNVKDFSDLHLQKELIKRQHCAEPTKLQNKILYEVLKIYCCHIWNWEC